ncbi:hypothetical protein JW905_11095 [bacterium]|nr:hypothetical protein [candidate division CSSED10-310 bacterium]
MNRPLRIDLKYLIAAAIVMGLVVGTCGPDLAVIASVLVLMDLVIATTVVISGFHDGRNGRIVGGAVCGLIAIASAPTASAPGVGAVLMLVLGGVLGVGGFVVGTTGDMFR